MSDYRVRTVALDERSCGEVHRATLDVLAKTGVEVHHDKALTLLARAGARVDGTRVRIPSELIDEALALAPRSVTMTSRGAGEPLRLESGAAYYGSGSDCIYVLDREHATAAPRPWRTSKRRPCRRSSRTSIS